MNNITNDQINGSQRRQDLKSKQAEKRKLTTEQLPVFRAAANVLQILIKTVMSAPRKAMRFSDRAISDASETLKCITLANMLNGEDRTYYLQMAETNAVMIKCYARIFEGMGVMGSSDVAQLKKLLKSLTAQLAGWRVSTNAKGSLT